MKEDKIKKLERRMDKLNTFLEGNCGVMAQLETKIDKGLRAHERGNYHINKRGVRESFRMFLELFTGVCTLIGFVIIVGAFVAIAVLKGWMV